MTVLSVLVRTGNGSNDVGLLAAFLGPFDRGCRLRLHAEPRYGEHAARRPAALRTRNRRRCCAHRCVQLYPAVFGAAVVVCHHVRSCVRRLLSSMLVRSEWFASHLTAQITGHSVATAAVACGRYSPIIPWYKGIR